MSTDLPSALPVGKPYFFAALNWLLGPLCPFTPTVRLVAVALLRRARTVDGRWVCWPSIPTLCSDTGFKRTAVIEALAVLAPKPKADGTPPAPTVWPLKVTRTPTFDERGQLSNLYELAFHVSPVRQVAEPPSAKRIQIPKREIKDPDSDARATAKPKTSPATPTPKPPPSFTTAKHPDGGGTPAPQLRPSSAPKPTLPQARTPNTPTFQAPPQRPSFTQAPTAAAPPKTSPVTPPRSPISYPSQAPQLRAKPLTAADIEQRLKWEPKISPEEKQLGLRFSELILQQLGAA